MFRQKIIRELTSYGGKTKFICDKPLQSLMVYRDCLAAEKEIEKEQKHKEEFKKNMASFRLIDSVSYRNYDL